jgi:hypothetical protein
MFCKAAIESVKALPFGPGEDCVFVANDWHSALIPLIIKVGTLACSGGWHAASNLMQPCYCCLACRTKSCNVSPSSTMPDNSHPHPCTITATLPAGQTCIYSNLHP